MHLRKVFRGLFGLLAMLQLAGYGFAADPIKIGFMDPLSGPFANVGEHGAREMLLAIEAVNAAGGVLGGISSGQDLVVSIAVKPTSSIRLPRASIDRSGAATTVETHGRHDPCVGIRATPIAEAMLALVVMDHVLRQRAQNADVHVAVPPIAGAAPGSPRR